MISSTDEQYASLIRSVMERGKPITTRNSKVLRLVNYPITFDRFPLVSVRKTAWKSALREWEFFLSGSNDIKDLDESVRHWWQYAADENGSLGRGYAIQFRRWGCHELSEGFDQVKALIEGLRDHPYSRRHVITTWNSEDMWEGLCEPTTCHGTIIQCFVDEENNLDLLMYQRSVDVICGLPHNICQYWAFLMWLAHESGRKVGKFHWIGGDVHVYEQHFDLANKILLNVENCTSEPDLVYGPPRSEMKAPPGWIRNIEFKADHFSLKGDYSPCLSDKAEMIV